MRYEKIIKRENGDKVKISVTFYDDFLKGSIYRIDGVGIQSKGKKKFIEVHSSDDYTWRALNMEDRYKYQLDIYKNHVTEDEMYEAKLELWNALKPIK